MRSAGALQSPSGLHFNIEKMSVVLVLVVVFSVCVLVGAFVVTLHNRNKPDQYVTNLLHSIGGMHGIVVGSRRKAKRLIAKELKFSGQVYECHYRKGNDIKTIVGVCHEVVKGKPRIEYLE